MDKNIKDKWDSYPANIAPVICRLRELILQAAKEEDLGTVEETLKWNELSYSVTSGSPIRLDWTLKTPHHCYVYFHCQTKLVDTFRELYDGVLQFQGNRAMVIAIKELYIEDSLPETQIKHCLKLALTYQKVKHLPLLGA
ncbi:DUF1801 domain-containing protein [Vibrio genomosp. F10]|uniref:DUF1801 domain-containing protein n=1 Tax=Vibrio genomosp. F10 TaxID=723171 RepID=UPI0002E1C44F|nr:DUF1801 domain-containing protein [Vibrio genomosp. F10]OEE94466.1 hypothetical protein A1QK_16465 [Vibrio genomosp. F10 str. 9ZD137]